MYRVEGIYKNRIVHKYPLHDDGPSIIILPLWIKTIVVHILKEIEYILIGIVIK